LFLSSKQISNGLDCLYNPDNVDKWLLETLFPQHSIELSNSIAAEIDHV